MSKYACVCACYLRQLLNQLRAGGPWHQCGWREARFWRRVQRVLNPGLLEGSLSFSQFYISCFFLFYSHQSVCKACPEIVLQFEEWTFVDVVVRLIAVNMLMSFCQLCSLKRWFPGYYKKKKKKKNMLADNGSVSFLLFFLKPKGALVNVWIDLKK